jgi:hypothetical protein
MLQYNIVTWMAKALLSNGRGFDSREFTVACVTQQQAVNTRSSKTQFYCCVPFEVSVG